MAKETNGQNGQSGANNQALTANQKEQVRLAIRTIYRDWKDPLKQDTLPSKNMSFNEATNGLVHSKETNFSEKNLGEIATMMKFANPNLDKWTDEVLTYISKLIDVSKYKADDRATLFLDIGMKFETWFKKEFNNSKRKSFTGDKLKIADVLDYFIANRKEFPTDVFKTLSYPIGKKRMSVIGTNELELINSKMSA